jgi:hypothetical protein
MAAMDSEIGLGEVPLEHLEHEICELASHVEAGMARWIALVSEYDRRDGWSSWRGVRAPPEWIAWRCSYAPRAAREHVRVARALRELPRTRAAFSRGELSYSKARCLTRVATADSETDLLHLARYATASQLERMLRAYRASTVEEANAAYDQRELWWHWASDGSLHLGARLPAEEGRVFLRALETARAQIREESRAADDENGSAEPRDDGISERHRDLGPNGEILLGRVARNSDALSRVCESFLEHGPATRSGSNRHHVLVHVDANTLSSDAPGRAQMERGPTLAPETARRLGCDASIQTIVKRGRKALFVGRKTRAISPSLELALRERDGGCRFPGCDNERWVDAHHIVHWAHGGETNLDNLILLCRHHHRLVHEGGFSVHRKPDGELIFRNPRGERLANAPKTRRGSLRELLTRNHDAGLEIDHETLLTGTGERMDLPACVDAVYDANRSPPELQPGLVVNRPDDRQVAAAPDDLAAAPLGHVLGRRWEVHVLLE